MPEIEIDTSQLTLPLVAIPEAGTGLVDGSSATRRTVLSPARTGYHVQSSRAAHSLVTSSSTWTILSTLMKQSMAS
jgi:hypothetical protein